MFKVDAGNYSSVWWHMTGLSYFSITAIKQRVSRGLQSMTVSECMLMGAAGSSRGDLQVDGRGVPGCWGLLKPQSLGRWQTSSSHLHSQSCTSWCFPNSSTGKQIFKHVSVGGYSHHLPYWLNIGSPQNHGNAGLDSLQLGRGDGQGVYMESPPPFLMQENVSSLITMT